MHEKGRANALPFLLKVRNRLRYAALNRRLTNERPSIPKPSSIAVNPPSGVEIT